MDQSGQRVMVSASRNASTPNLSFPRSRFRTKTGADDDGTENGSSADEYFDAGEGFHYPANAVTGHETTESNGILLDQQDSLQRTASPQSSTTSSSANRLSLVIGQPNHTAVSFNR